MSRSTQARQLARHLTEVTGARHLELIYHSKDRWDLGWVDGPLVEEMRAHLDTALAGRHYVELRDRTIACSRSHSDRAWAARAIAARREGTLAPAVAKQVAYRRSLGVELPRLGGQDPREGHEYYALLHCVERLWEDTSYPERASAPEDEPLIEQLLAAGTTKKNGWSRVSEYDMAHVLLAAGRAPAGDQPPAFALIPGEKPEPEPTPAPPATVHSLIPPRTALRPVSDTESTAVPPDTLRRWQRRGHKLLATFLADADRLDLPPLVWTLALSGALTGEADGISYTPAQRREAVRRWAEHLGAAVDQHHTTDGREELYAGWKIDVEGEIGPVPGCIRATIGASEPDPERSAL